MGMKYELEGAFNAFLEEHLEFTNEYMDKLPSPHTPRFSYIDTTAEEEFNVHSLLSALNEKELYFLSALMNQMSIWAMMDAGSAADEYEE